MLIEERIFHFLMPSKWQASGLRSIFIMALSVIAFGLRLAYTLTSHPFIDEFTSVLAAQTILRQGLPILPSGLFYEHGLLFSYLAAPFVALAGQPPEFFLARLPSIFLGTLLIPLVYRVGQGWFSPLVGIMAALLLTVSPESIVWAGRARMYALAQLLVLALVYLAYQGSFGRGQTRYRWLMLLTLLAALLTQLGTLLLVGPLLVGMTALKWLQTPHRQPSSNTQSRPDIWSQLRSRLPLTVPEWLGLGVVLGVGLLVKRLGQPLGAPQLGSTESGNLILELWGTIAYQIGPILDYDAAVKFLARQFGVPHNIWLILIALIGLAAFLGLAKFKPPTRPQLAVILFLWLVFGLVVVEMLTLLQPFRRNPRYLVMTLPLLYLLTAAGLEQIHRVWQSALNRSQSWILTYTGYGLILTLGLWLHGNGLHTSLNIIYRTPEPAYEEAFQYVAQHRRPHDAVLTMNPTAAALYLPELDYFAVQAQAEQFLLNRETAPVDRWLGKPWLGNTAEFNQVLNEHPQTWFVIDTTRLPVYYHGDWQALLKTQMDLVWAEDEALIYRTKSERQPLPDEPAFQIRANLADQIQLLGYTNSIQAPTADQEGHLSLILFWEALQEMPIDYTIFVHIRDAAGANIAQGDAQPLDGAYPTSQWQPGETIIDPHQVTLPTGLAPGSYQLWTGMYQLETLTRLAVSRDQSGENAILLGEVEIPGLAE